MALTVASLKKSVFGNKRTVTATVTFDASYATGGVALAASTLGMSAVEFLIAHTSGGYVFEYDYTNAKLMAYAGGGAGAHTHDLLFIGGIATTEAVMIASGDTLGKNAATDRTIAGSASATKGGVVASSASTGAISEVANTTDLSAVVTRIFAIGC